jgi:hypothetical protein
MKVRIPYIVVLTLESLLYSSKKSNPDIKGIYISMKITSGSNVIS